MAHAYLKEGGYIFVSRTVSFIRFNSFIGLCYPLRIVGLGLVCSSMVSTVFTNRVRSCGIALQQVYVRLFEAAD